MIVITKLHCICMYNSYKYIFPRPQHQLLSNV